jgi:hypothetical protein
MTIKSIRFQFEEIPHGRWLGGQLSPMSDWLEDYVKPIRSELRGPEAKGVDIVNFYLYEDLSKTPHPNEWWHRGNSFQYSFKFDFTSLIDLPLTDSALKLLEIVPAFALRAPWPQVRAIGKLLANPIPDEDKSTLKRHLTPYPHRHKNSFFGS